MKMPRLIKTFALASLVLCTVAGCGTRTIIVPPGEPVQIAEDIEVDTWVKDKDGNKVKAKSKIPAGWFALPDQQ